MTTEAIEGTVVHHPNEQESLLDTQRELAATQQQLDLLGKYFLLALAKFPDNTMKVSLPEQMSLDKIPLVLQGKTDKHGNTHFRAVEVK